MTERDPDVYAAIADQTRRRILQLLVNTEMSVNEIAEGFAVTRPAISQHLGVLRDAGLVTYRKDGRTRFYRAQTAPLGEVIDWLSYFDHFWTNGIARLSRYLDEET
jgi:DNA-binding transcriptional ArsR family regulator